MKQKPSFEILQKRVVDFGKNDLLYWAVALAGEVGEICNIIKKRARGDKKYYDTIYGSQIFEEEIELEIGDILIYLELFCRKIPGINLVEAFEKSILKVEKRMEANL